MRLTGSAFGRSAAGLALGVVVFVTPASACVVGTGTSASCTQAALLKCLPGGAAFDGVVTFRCGVGVDIVVTSRRWITADTVIDGGDRVSLSGNGNNEILGVSSGVKLTLRNISIDDGRSQSGNGAGIYNNGDLDAFNARFWQNSAVIGGAIFNASGSTARCHSCQFLHNEAGFGGAIANDADAELTVTLGAFGANYAQDPGAALLERQGTDTGRSAQSRPFGFTVAAETAPAAVAAGITVLSFAGAAIGNYGTATIDETSFFSNTAYTSSGSFAAAGAAIANGGDLVVTRSEFLQNTSSASFGSIGAAGGAIVDVGTLAITNSTFFENGTSGGAGSPLGGALLAQGIAALTNSTFTNNGPGGAISSVGDPAGIVTVRNSIVTSSIGGNCIGNVNDGGYNIDDKSTCGFGGTGCSTIFGTSRCMTDPRLDELQENGGWTLTSALCTAAGVPGPSCKGASPAISAGSAFHCSATGRGAVGGRDQRGYVRPGIGATSCSIGAFEANSYPSSVPYAALGDSYSSGEGVEPFFSDSTTASIWTFPRNDCHRSKTAYPVLDPYFDGAGSMQTSPRGFVACSGATTANVRTGVRRAFNPITEPAQLGRGLLGFDTELVTISVGGNDVGFAETIGICVRDFLSYQEKCKTLLRPDNVAARIADLVPKLEATYDEIRSLVPAWTKVAVLGYPRLVSGVTCPEVQGTSVLGGVTLKLNLETEIQDLIRDAADALNAAIADTARKAGFNFISVAGAFEPHLLCKKPGPSWIHGIVDPSGPKQVYSFHPNSDGHAAYAERVAECLSPSPPTDCNAELPMFATSDSSRDAGDALSIGRLSVTSVAQPGCDQQVRLAAGTPVRLQAGGFASGADVAVTLDSVQTAAERSLGSIPADEHGNVEGTVMLPADLAAPDVVSITGAGIGEHGEARIADALLAVEASYGVDADGDGVPNVCDNCRETPNATQSDTDRDGAGDHCDGCISAPGDVCPIPTGACGDVNDSGNLSAADALAILKAAVGGNQCTGRMCVCDVNGSGSVTASDALTTLRVAVGQNATLDCQCD